MKIRWVLLESIFIHYYVCFEVRWKGMVVNMKTIMKGSLCVVTLILCTFGFFFGYDTLSAHQQNVATISGDAESPSDGTKEITIQVKDTSGSLDQDKKHYFLIDGEDVSLSTVGGKASFQLPSYDKVVIQPNIKHRQYEPAYYIIEKNQVADTYTFTYLGDIAVTDIEQDPKITYDGKDPSEYNSFNEAGTTINIETKKPLAKILYTIGKEKGEGEEKEFTGAFQLDLKGLQAITKQTGDRANGYICAYTTQNYGPNSKYDASNKTCTLINLNKEVGHLPSPPPDVTTPSDANKYKYEDKDGNRYTEDEVQLNIGSLSNTATYENVIKSLPAFKDIPASQIKYYDIKLLANRIKVQPIAKYPLVIPYPENTSKDNDFVIYHFIDGKVDDYEKLTYSAKSDGLHVEVDSLSPFIVGWKVKDATNDPTKDTNTVTPPVNQNTSNRNTGVNTGDSTNVLVLFTICAVLYGAGIYFIRKRYYS